MSEGNFFAELKRRNVIRMAGLYLVGSWLLIQVASTMLPAFDGPAWVLRGIIIALALGFIPMLIFSWVFELTPEGLKRDQDVKPEQSIAPQTARRMNRMIMAVLVLALAYFAVDKFVLAPRRALGPNASSSAISAKSIAVLPFENLSSDKENAYFAEGIQDEILTRLAKVADLKVISRTSTQKYKSAPDNLREVGKELGVANLLEGSVQKVANAVHVNVQLIRAATDEHLWAESYNRKLDDIFGVEGEVAGAIAEQLNAKLTGTEKQQFASKPTNNSEAYDAYLRGLALQGRVDSPTNWVNSVKAFEEAVRLDPDFAVAWAQLSRQNALVFQNFEPTPQRREAARSALDKAMKLGPSLVETELANAWYHYWVERDFEGAKTQFEALARKYPNNAQVPEALAGIARRQGHWEQSRLLYGQAIELDPQNVFLLADASITDLATRDAASAQKHLGRARDLSPQNGTVIAFLANSFQLSGDIQKAQSILDSIQPGEGNIIYASAFAGNAILLRKYDRAIAVLKAQLGKPEALGSLEASSENLLADLQRHAGDAATAATSYRRVQHNLGEALPAQPDNANVLSTLAWADACLEDKSAALAHVHQAIALLPASKDAYVGPGYEDTLARIEAHFGDKESAIAALQHLLSISYGPPPVTRALLRIDPDWDNLRGDPRFEKLAAEQ